MLTSPTSSTIHTVQDTLIMPTTHHPSSASTSSSSSSSFAGSSISLTAQQSPNNLHGRQQFPSSSSTQILPATSPILGGGSVGVGSVGHTAFVVPTSIYLPSSRPNGKLILLHCVRFVCCHFMAELFSIYVLYMSLCLLSISYSNEKLISVKFLHKF